MAETIADGKCDFYFSFGVQRRNLSVVALVATFAHAGKCGHLGMAEKTPIKTVPFRTREINRLTTLRERLFSPQCSRSIEDQVHLGKGFESENLFTDIRDDALAFFESRKIAWHGGSACDRSILSSQIAALNFLFPLCQHPDELSAVLRQFFPDFAKAMPITADRQDRDKFDPFVTFEWIGLKNYLKEPGKRQRGKWVTNVDALFKFRQTDDQIHLVLAEWKYTESYQRAKVNQFSQSGTDRLEVYAPLLTHSACPIKIGFPVGSLFVDPFYQLMRLQLLAREMEQARELDADIVSVLLITPSANRELNSTISCGPLKKGHTCIQDAWKSVTAPDRFNSIHTEDLLKIIVKSSTNLQWVNYLQCRYGGMC
jgi:hypothetical protein